MLILYTLILPLYFSSVNAIVNVNVDRRDFEVGLALQEELASKREQDGTQALTSIEEIAMYVSHVDIPGKQLPFHAVATLKKGNIAKIGGASGTGKSSFAKALIKFRPISGVSYNGIPIAEIRNRDLRGRVEYLSQNVPIIKGTLRENLFFNSEWSHDAELQFKNEPVLQTIFADKTLDTEILDCGANLSGGEKQKIALARALQSGADVLILDEICSNIDKASASDIYKRLDIGRKARITFIITHDTLPEGFTDVELNTQTA